MDTLKIQGIIDAVEAESRQPSPSHNNLARLLAMFMKETIEKDPKQDDPIPVCDIAAQESVNTTLPVVEMTPPKKKSKKSK